LETTAMHNTPEVESPKKIILLGTINKTMQISIITKIVTAGKPIFLK
jgi:hypothetical protein